jgi:hypothetical protein
MSVATAIIKLTTKEMRNKMNKTTFSEMTRQLQSEIEFENPSDTSDLTYARMLGLIFAHTSNETLEFILQLRKKECVRCGEIVLPSQHSEMGCDL